MAEHIESGYAFIFVQQIKNNHYLDFYVNRHMLAQLQLRPGSIVLAQGLNVPHPALVSIRPSKGSEHHALGRFPFMASIRFPNLPSVLGNFLNAAHDRGISFTSIRTHGARGDAMADVLFEGVLLRVGPGFEPGKAIATELSEPAREASGDVISAYSISLGNYELGTILTSGYEVDLPILKGSYSKVRFNTGGRGRPLKELEDRLYLIRAQLDVARTTVTFDLSMTKVPVSIFSFNAADLRPNSPVTQTVLSSLLPLGVNVDAIDAFEYLEQGPKTMVAGHRGGQLTGTIEMLLTSESPLDPGSEVRIREKLEAENWSLDPPVVRLTDLESEFAGAKRSEVPEDTACRFFRKTLADGRYAFVERVGEGAFGIVNKYLDLQDGRMVAGKHIKDPESYKLKDEVEMLIRAGEIKSSSRHLARILGGFYDGVMPVIIMDFVEYSLADHRANPHESEKRKVHLRPRSVAEFVEMALQLTQGLEDMHAAGFVHSDVKPPNIGFLLAGGESIWKLLDFNLARHRPASGGVRDYEYTEMLVGTPLYRAPQAEMLKRYANNDIFSLGVTFFQVLNDWRFPGTPEDGSERHFEEVDAFIAAERQNMRDGPKGFSESKWKLSEPFRLELSNGQAEAALRGIVFRMMAFEADERFKAARDVYKALMSWNEEWLQPGGPSEKHPWNGQSGK